MGKNKRNNNKQQQQHKSTQQAATTTTTTPTPTPNAKNATPKSNSNSGALRIPSLSEKDRRALNAIAQAILKLVQTQTANPNEEWKQYVELQRLLDSMMLLEKPLQLATRSPEDSSGVESEKTRLAKVAAFNEWARAGGVQSDCVEITTFPGYQLGLRAKRDIAAEELVLSVPRKLIFSEELLPEWKRELFRNFPTHLNVTYTLIIEKVRGAASAWQPFIDTLPTRYSTVLYFTVDQMQRLRGTSACSAAMRHCLVIARLYASMYKCAYIQPGDNVMAAKANLFTEYGLCYELYRWAVSTVTTRQNLVPRELSTVGEVDQVCQLGGFEGTEIKRDAETGARNAPISALIPYWDMTNHRCGKITSYYDRAAQQMECTAQEAFKAGEQFFIYYGDRSNADRLVHHGFLDMHNLKDYVQIRLGLSPTDPLVEQRSLLLAELNIERKAELRVLPAPEHISGELLAFVRVFNMSKEQLEHWCSDLERAVDLLHIDCALETDLETRTWQYLYQRLKLLLGVLEASLHEADERQQLEALQREQVEQPSASRDIDIMVLQYRRLERCILTDALQYAQERLKV
ncbi:actin-histidine N-methyltransferase [Drosophila grimshawi]|uniref:protein-histidine N-methyltransferase n=1 Tax=Drosophila grimshawi TaxID=7222 RepID=B4JJ96_DROGR|nr:actin-histidine N-methyltransferase [Drosophila grimshawi]EDV99648.1 GH12451 [Drosophila grimshawi]